MVRKYNYGDTLDSYFINQLLDEFEADLAEGHHATLLNKFIKIREELASYFETAEDFESILSNVEELIDEVKGEL